MTQSDMDATTPKYLRNKYAIVGVGETTYRRGSQESTRNLATWAGWPGGRMLVASPPA